MFLAFVRLVMVVLVVALCGCEPSWTSQFKPGTKLYEKNGHRYFGKVVAYEPTHDFHNGTPPQAAVQIELSEGGAAARTWGACSTCAATFDVE